MGSKTQQGQVLIELLFSVGLLVAIFYLMFGLSQVVIDEENRFRFARASSRAVRP